MKHRVFLALMFGALALMISASVAAAAGPYTYWNGTSSSAKTGPLGYHDANCAADNYSTSNWKLGIYFNRPGLSALGYRLGTGSVCYFTAENGLTRTYAYPVCFPNQAPGVAFSFNCRRWTA